VSRSIGEPQCQQTRGTGGLRSGAPSSERKLARAGSAAAKTRPHRGHAGPSPSGSGSPQRGQLCRVTEPPQPCSTQPSISNIMRTKSGARQDHASGRPGELRHALAHLMRAHVRRPGGHDDARRGTDRQHGRVKVHLRSCKPAGGRRRSSWSGRPGPPSVGLWRRNGYGTADQAEDGPPRTAPVLEFATADHAIDGVAPANDREVFLTLVDSAALAANRLLHGGDMVPRAASGQCRPSMPPWARSLRVC